MDEIRGTSVLILGYGREGKSVHRYLSEKAPSLKIGIADSSEITPLFDAGEIAIHTGENYLAACTEYDTIIRSPGISSSIPELREAEKRGVHLSSLSNIFMSQAPGTVIGVTGTKGKSTTASLIFHILHQFFDNVRLVGNIGHPALDFLEDANEETVFVAEFSSFQLEDIRYSPQISVFLEVYPEHLDYHGSFSSYLNAKQNILRFQKAENNIVVRKDVADVFLRDLAYQGQVRPYSRSKKDASISFTEADCLCLRSGKTIETVLEVENLPLKGSGNLDNILAAVTTTSLFDIPASDIADSLKTFETLEHRLQYVGSFKGIEFYNDSLSTIPQSAINGLEALGERVETMILGGHDRGIEYCALGEALAKSKVKTLLLFPSTGEKIWEALCRNIENPEQRPARFDVNSMKEAVAIAYQESSKGTICLLSPASSSLNLFRDYQDRGESFIHWVKTLGAS